MNTYVFSVYDLDCGECSIEKVIAKTLKDAYIKVSDIYDLDSICYTQDELYENMYDRQHLVIGELIDIDLL